MKTEYLVSIDAYIDANSKDEAINEFRQWVSETDASIFDVKETVD